MKYDSKITGWSWSIKGADEILLQLSQTEKGFGFEN